MFLYVCDWSHTMVVLNLVWNVILDKWLFCSHVIFSQMNHGSNLLSLIFLLSVCWNNTTICILLLKGKIISDSGFKIKKIDLAVDLQVSQNNKSCVVWAINYVSSVLLKTWACSWLTTFTKTVLYWRTRPLSRPSKEEVKWENVVQPGSTITD